MRSHRLALAAAATLCGALWLWNHVSLGGAKAVSGGKNGASVQRGSPAPTHQRTAAPVRNPPFGVDEVDSICVQLGRYQTLLQASKSLDLILQLQRLVRKCPSAISSHLFDVLDHDQSLVVRSIAVLLLGGIRDKSVLSELEARFSALENAKAPEDAALRILLVYAFGLADQRGVRDQDLAELWRYRLCDADYWQSMAFESCGVERESDPVTQGMRVVPQFGTVSDDQLRARLMRLTDSEDDGVAHLSLLVLERSVVKEDVCDFFYERLLRSSDPREISHELAVLGGAAGNSDLVARIISILERASDSEVTVAAVKAIARIDSPGALEMLVARYDAMESRTRLAVLDAIRQHARSSVCPFAVKVARSGTEDERRTAVACLGEIGTEDAASELYRSATADSAEAVRCAALEALAWNDRAARAHWEALRSRAASPHSELERKQLERTLQILRERFQP